MTDTVLADRADIGGGNVLGDEKITPLERDAVSSGKEQEHIIGADGGSERGKGLFEILPGYVLVDQKVRENFAVETMTGTRKGVRQGCGIVLRVTQGDCFKGVI